MLQHQLHHVSHLPLCFSNRKKVYTYVAYGYTFQVILLANGNYMHYSLCVTLGGYPFYIFFISNLPFQVSFFLTEKHSVTVIFTKFEISHIVLNSTNSTTQIPVVICHCGKAATTAHNTVFALCLKHHLFGVV